VLPPPQRYDYLSATTHGHDPILRVLPTGSTNWLLATSPSFTANYIQPTLTFSAASGTNTLTWNVPAFKLQSCLDLAAGSWTDYPGGTNSSVNAPMILAKQFFRLAPK
jgi:hypothetical protein